MSKLYKEALDDFQSDEFSTDDLPAPPELPTNFHSDVSSPNVGSGELDAAVADYILQWAARQEQPFVETDPSMYAAFSATDERFKEPAMDFFEALDDHHGRSLAYYHVVRLGAAKTHNALLDEKLPDYEHDDPAVMRDELYEALTHQNAETKKPITDDGAATDVGRVVLDYIDAQRGKREIIRPIDDMPGHGGGDSEKIYRTFLIDAGWSDYRRACLLLEPTVPGDVVRRYDKRDTIFEVIGRHHNGENFRADSDAADGAGGVERTQSVLKTLRSWIDSSNSNSEAITSAITGLSGEDYDQLIPAFKHSDQKQLEMWVEAGGDFRAHELYRAAEYSFDDPDPVAFVNDHYDADVEKLTKALQRVIEAMAESPCRMDDPLATSRWLIEQGADPKATTPSLLECFLEKMYWYDDATHETVEAARAVGTISGPIQEPEAALEHYEIGELPDPLATIGAVVYEPLIERNILPTDEQFKRLQKHMPEHAHDLLDHLPPRKRNYLQAAISKELA